MVSAQPTRELAAFFADLGYESLPLAVRERVTNIILDTVASALAGRHGDETAQIQVLATAIGGPKRSTVIAGPRQSLAGATLLNGYQITAVTVCDIHRPLFVSRDPAGCAAFSWRRRRARLERTRPAGRRRRRPRDRLKGRRRYSLSINAGARLARARCHRDRLVGPRQSRCFSDSTSTDFKTLSRSPALSPPAPLPIGAPRRSSSISPRGALSGLMAALLAEQGFKAGPEIFTAEHGGLFSLYSDGGDPSVVAAGLGDDWELNTISLRLWPAGSSIQSVITAVSGIDGEA